jgi:hypothetical protein
MKRISTLRAKYLAVFFVVPLVLGAVLASELWASDPLLPPSLEGCTPGYWKQPQHFDSWGPTGYSPDDSLFSVFGILMPGGDITLEEALWARGGGLNKLVRHGTAALLNAFHPDVNYAVPTNEIIPAVQHGLADLLANFNEYGCPLD